MNKQIAQIWCQALRSGEFTQSSGYLDRGKSQCVLGVLVQLALTVGVCDYTEVKNFGAYDNELGRVPVSVKEWAGMYGQSGEIRGEFVTLTWYNDFGGFTLSEIADIIEENWERL